MINNQGPGIVSARHFMLAENFFQLVENILNEMIKSGNANVMVTLPNKDIPSVKEDYRKLTKWSDFRILIPTLFNFFHGIELFLKAANYKNPTFNCEPNHKLSQLFSDFKTYYSKENELIELLNKYIYPTEATVYILTKFYKENGLMDSEKFYEVFKYPFTKSLDFGFKYRNLLNLTQTGLLFFNQMVSDIKTIRVKIETL